MKRRCAGRAASLGLAAERTDCAGDRQLTESEGFSARAPRASKTAAKSAFPDNRGGLCVPMACSGPADAAHADSARWETLFHGKTREQQNAPALCIVVAASQKNNSQS